MKLERRISEEEYKLIQLDILSSVDKFCVDNDIRYSIACGTLLGAVRHKGYIPWDDDIDIYMLREDYIRFCSLFPDILDGKYRLASFEMLKNFDRIYANIYDDRTIFVEEGNYDYSIGVNIDVFPIDDVPEGYKWRLFKKLLFLLFLIRNFKILKLSTKRSVFKNIFLLLGKLICILIPLNSLLKCINSIIQSNNNLGYFMCYSCCFGIDYPNPFPRSLFDRLKLYPFEDRVYYGFEDADCYLKLSFGNYMKLPPKENQISHHSYVAFWK